MINNIIDARLKRYSIQTLEDEENALKEILQEVALYALSTTNFFSKALFQGGTSLRILYHLPRFSEDLDFLLKQPDPSFHWQPYVHQMEQCFELFSIEPEIIDRSQSDKAVQKLFLKDNSIGKVINLNFKYHSHRKLLIKLEIDTNPPLYSGEEIKFLDFPVDYSVLSQDLSSNFAGKIHALLCRSYIKGRDWFDFSWYVANQTQLNFKFLSSALNQTGDWKNMNLTIDKHWLLQQLSKKVQSLNWQPIHQEVARLVNPEHQTSLQLWNVDFFMNKIQKLTHYLQD
jgi:predicted nucleotidyltransferase component of viral defense system